MSKRFLMALIIIPLLSSLILTVSVSPKRVADREEYVVGGIITPTNNLLIIEAWIAVLIVVLAVTAALMWKVKPIYQKI